MFTRRKLISTAFLATTLTASGITPSFAIGGNDPISGIDIIIKKNPGSKPINPFSVSGSNIERLNSLKGDDRAEFVMKVIADRIGEGREFVRAGTGVLGRHMCSGCEVRDDIEIEFEAGGLDYSIYLKLGPIMGESQDK